jgi:hypothetical protein
VEVDDLDTLAPFFTDIIGLAPGDPPRTVR